MIKNVVTKEEAIEQLKNKKIGNSQNKLAKFLQEPNVKSFNKILVNRVFSEEFLNHRGQRVYSLDNEEQCANDCLEFFNLCHEYNMIPSLASLAVYLRTDKDTLHRSANNPNCPAYGCLRQAVQLCHSFQEQCSLHGEINNVLFMYLSKNYYNMNDNNTLTLNTNTENNTVNNSNTMKIIQEQIELENKANNERKDTN